MGHLDVAPAKGQVALEKYNATDYLSECIPDIRRKFGVNTEVIMFIKRLFKLPH